MQTFEEWRTGQKKHIAVADAEAAWNAAVEAARADLLKPSPCGQKFADGTPHPMACWRVTKYKYPEIPKAVKNPIVFMDANLGIALVGDYAGDQWIFKNVNDQWVSQRKTDSRDPIMIVPLPESGYCLICDSEAKLRADAEAAVTKYGAMYSEVEDKLTALREGLAGLVDKHKLLLMDCLKQIERDDRRGLGSTSAMRARAEMETNFAHELVALLTGEQNAK